MTRPERLHYLLEEINNKKSNSLLTIWTELLDTSNIFEIYDRLIYVKKEIDLLELEMEVLGLGDSEQFKKIIATLNTIIEYPSLNASIASSHHMQSSTINLTFAAFDMLKTFERANHIILEQEEDIPDDEFILFRQNINNIIDEVERSYMLEFDKLIFLSIFHDINKGFSLYKINGLDAFIEVLRNNFCKIKMISDLEEDTPESIKFKNLMKKTVGKIWIWTQTYTKKKVIGLLESKLKKSLDESFSEWAELPLTDSTNAESVEGEE